MATSLISTRQQEIYAKNITVKAKNNGDDTILLIEFFVSSEPEHPPYSPHEKANKREFHLVNTGTGITSDYYNVTTEADPTSDANTKFTLEVKIDSKIPGTGGDALKTLNRSLKKQNK